MPRFISFFVTCLLLLPLGLLAQDKATITSQSQPEAEVKVSPLPAWVTPATPDLSRQAPSLEGGARYLLSDQQENIAEPGLQRFAHVVMQPVNEQGLEQVSEIRVSFNPNFEILHWHSIDVIRKGKRSSRLDPKKLKIYSDEKDMKNRQFSGRVTSLAILEDIRVGDFIEYAFTIEGMNPVLGDKRFGSFSASWGVSVEKVNLRLVTRPNQYVNLSHQEQMEKTSNGQYTSYRWQYTDTPAVREEDKIPGWFSPYDFIEYSEYHNWAEVIEWALPLYQPQALPDDLKPMLKKWKEKYRTKKERLAAAIRFVQDDIRYFGIELGQNTHRPYTPSEVVQRRFGDCKDKAVLLSSILGALGVKAYPALVSSYGGKALPKYLPSPGVFDHVISWFKYDGNEYWIDGTISHQRGGLERMGAVNYDYALVVKDNTSRLKKFQENPKRRPNIQTTEEYQIIDDDFTTRLTVTTTYDGMRADSLRYRIASNGIESLQKQNLSFYAQYFSHIESEAPLTVSDNPELNQIILTEKYLIKDWSINKNGKRYLPVFAADINDFLVKPQIRNRKYPFSVAHGFSYKQKQILHIPKEKVIGLNTSSNNQNTPYFQYSRQVQQSDESIVISQSFSPKVEFVDAEKTQDYMQRVKALGDTLGLDVVLANHRTGDLKEQDKKLRSLAQRLLKKQ